MQKGGNCQSIDILFVYICALKGNGAGYMEDGGLTKVSRMYSGLLLQVYSRRCRG